MTDLQKIRLWEHLKKDFLQNIKDIETRKLYYKTLLVKATKEFGFNPEKCDVKKQNDVELDDWEKEFVEDIKKAEIYELDTRVEKRKKTHNEAKARMRDFVESGGSLSDLPEDLRNESIVKLYLEVLGEKIDECGNFLFTK